MWLDLAKLGHFLWSFGRIFVTLAADPCLTFALSHDYRYLSYFWGANKLSWHPTFMKKKTFFGLGRLRVFLSDRRKRKKASLEIKMTIGLSTTNRKISGTQTQINEKSWAFDFFWSHMKVRWHLNLLTEGEKLSDISWL